MNDIVDHLETVCYLKAQCQLCEEIEKFYIVFSIALNNRQEAEDNFAQELAKNGWKLIPAKTVFKGQNKSGTVKWETGFPKAQYEQFDILVCPNCLEDLERGQL